MLRGPEGGIAVRHTGHVGLAKLVAAYVPWRVNTHRIRTSMWYPQLVGFTRSPILVFNFWKYVDIDLGAPTVATR